MKLLILDLDETLIRAVEEPLVYQADFRAGNYHVYKRPYLDQFLSFCQESFRVGVWTTAGSDFAQIVVDNIFPNDFPLEFSWSRTRCTKAYDTERMQPYYIKNLAKLKRKGYQLEKMIMVDDTPQKLEKNYGNLVRVSEWVGDRTDKELLWLREYLAELDKVENIRTVEKRGWQTRYQV